MEWLKFLATHRPKVHGSVTYHRKQSLKACSLSSACIRLLMPNVDDITQMNERVLKGG